MHFIKHVFACITYTRPTTHVCTSIYTYMYIDIDSDQRSQTFICVCIYISTYMCTFICQTVPVQCTHTSILGISPKKKTSTWWISKMKTACILSGWQTPATSGNPGRLLLQSQEDLNLSRSPCEVSFCLRFFSLWSTYLQWHVQPSTAMKDCWLHLSDHTSGRQGTLRDSTIHVTTLHAKNWWHFRLQYRRETSCCLPGSCPPPKKKWKWF